MAHESDGDGARARVLVVDDSRLMRAAFAKILGEEFELAYAGDGEQGWETLTADSEIEVVITDADMPRLDGYGLIGRIRESDEPRLQALPVIMVTGADDEATREKALAAGTTDFITKPLDPTQLRARVRAHARLDRTQRELVLTAKALETQGSVDSITGLSNRRHLLERGEQELSFARRHRKPLSLVVFTIDQCAELERQHGAQAAHKLLESTAQVLRARMRAEDTVARIDEYQFAVLAPATNRLQAVVLCKRLQAALAAPDFSAPDAPGPVTITLALEIPGREGDDPFEQHLERACARVANACEQGGDRLLLGERAPAPTPVPPTLDTAVDLLARGQGARLEGHLPALLTRLLPLLEFADRRLGLALGGALPALRARLGGGAGETSPRPAVHPVEEEADFLRRRPVEEAHSHNGER